MQLSIEAIIILVIAIVLLGLGIAFVKDFFGKGSNSLLGAFDTANERCDANSNTPIVPKTYSIKRGTTPANICVYNDQDSDIVDGTIIVDSCIGPNIAGSSTSMITITSLGQNIGRAKNAGYKTTVQADSSAEIGGTYICNIRVSGTNQKIIGPVQVTFTVN